MTFFVTGEDTLLHQSQLFIGGEYVSPDDGPAYERRDPVSDRVVTRAAAGRAADARRCATAAAAAFGAWAECPAETRAGILSDAAQIMLERAPDVIRIAADEIGSSEEWTRFNVEVAAATLREAARLPALLEQTQPCVAEAGKAAGMTYHLHRRPAGVVLGLAPWNAAVTLATRAVAAPLACGNSVILKASELCPKTHEWVARALCDAGLPPGVLNFITNSPDHAAEVVDALIAHPAVRRINFTGSTRVGREIAVQAAQYLKPCLLELSGKGTMVVLEDADLDLAAREAAHASFFNQGQICMSTERILVAHSVADRFLERFCVEADKLRGDSTGASPLGTLISAASVLRLTGIVEDALSKGARLACGGEAVNNIMQPTVLDRVIPGMRLWHEEAFGPLVGITRLEDEEEALSLANDTEFGLVASVFSKDTARADNFLRAVEVGIGHVNRSTVFDDPSMPFGGMKASGYGRFGGLEACNQFTEWQWITTPVTGDNARLGGGA
ncbi:MAG: aldehyde dehydrogenase family protein [Thalassovita sp.]|nr:aldehyde dehydrogenase family protein [Thalassovita sp.]